LATVDHKEIGKRNIVNTGTFLLIGGVEAILMRLQVGAPIPPC
jgi:heme/copper-type cytochrome/quinol oxidase subunit 1